MNEPSSEKCAEGVVAALMRDQIEATAKIDSKLDALELQLVAMARRRGMSEAEIAKFIRKP